jgi:hypothetical protein
MPESTFMPAWMEWKTLVAEGKANLAMSSPLWVIPPLRYPAETMKALGSVTRAIPVEPGVVQVIF